MKSNEVQKTENIIANQIRDEYANNMSKKWTLDELLYFTKELYHSTKQSSSVFILKDNGANIKFTVPESSQFGKTIKGDPLTTDIKKGNFRLIEGNLHYTIRKSGESQAKENSFLYPTVRNATWEIGQNKSGALEGIINFGVSPILCCLIILVMKEQIKHQEEKKESVLGAIKKYKAEEKAKLIEKKRSLKETER